MQQRLITIVLLLFVALSAVALYAIRALGQANSKCIEYGSWGSLLENHGTPMFLCRTYRLVTPETGIGSAQQQINFIGVRRFDERVTPPFYAVYSESRQAAVSLNVFLDKADGSSHWSAIYPKGEFCIYEVNGDGEVKVTIAVERMHIKFSK